MFGIATGPVTTGSPLTSIIENTRFLEATRLEVGGPT